SVFTGFTLPADAHGMLLDSSMLRIGAGYTSAGDANDHLIFDTNTSRLYYDADGRGGQAAVQIATLTGVSGASSLDANSFYITDQPHDLGLILQH
ncbi:MAG: hypothetical protein AB3X44_21225, partial [Leptothrix sp. (in: b-proteobacteria)]